LPPKEPFKKINSANISGPPVAVRGNKR